MLLPLLVLFIVLAGFYPWRSICPLAAFGELGRNLPRPSQRRVPEWLERGHIVVPFVVLASMLVFRHVATNGDGRWISGLLIVLALAAFATNALFTGKTWCNVFCPVGAVERMYTDPSSLAHRSVNSQCVRCTACKRSCPDIDQENNYWRELTGGGRRFATYAFPGLVFAFYWYFWLRTGDWEAYFDGRWTSRLVELDLAFGPGFFFSPGIPAVVAATATLAICALASFLLFLALEAVSRRWASTPERHRHLMLSIAAFCAFSIFYVFAGAPTLRRIPGGTRAFAFLAPTVAVLVLARRWNRSHEAYVRERVASRLMRHWPFEGKAARDPVEAYAQMQATEQAREQLLAAYRQTLRDVVADGIVDESEARLLAEMRKQFGITPREHESVIAGFADEERRLLESDRVVTVEERLQLESYRAALTEALLRGASEAELASLREEFGIAPEDHEAIVWRVRSDAGPLLDRARRELDQALARRADRSALAALPNAGEDLELIGYLLGRAEEAALGRVFDLLEAVGDRERLKALRPKLSSRDPEARARAYRELADASGEARELSARLQPFVSEPRPEVTAMPEESVLEMLARLSDDPDLFLRAAAVWSLGTRIRAAPEVLRVAREDREPLVTEAAGAALALEYDSGGTPREGRFAGRPRISRMAFLRRVPLFAELEPHDLLEVAELAREEEIAPGQALCEQDRPDSGDLFVILSGTAAVTVRGGPAGQERENRIAELGPGEVVGELSLVDGSPRSATVRPQGGPLQVLRIPAPAFRERLLPRGRVSRSLLMTLTQRLRAVASRLSER